jgi:hypothetical protein
MPVTAHINLTLDFDQVLDLVRQLPKKQQQQLAGIIAKEETPAKKLTAKEQAFLVELDGAVDFVNNYKKEKPATKTFKQMLDAL